MSLLRWMGVNSAIPGSNSTQTQLNQHSSDPNHKTEWWSQSGEKYFGMENVQDVLGLLTRVPFPSVFALDLHRLSITWGSYANSVLQALYFCKPFRELLELSSKSHFRSASSSDSPHSTCDIRLGSLPTQSLLCSPGQRTPTPRKLSPSKSAYLSSQSDSASNSRPNRHLLLQEPLSRLPPNPDLVRPESRSRASSTPRGAINARLDSSIPSATSEASPTSKNPTTDRQSTATNPTSTSTKRNFGAADLDQPSLGAFSRTTINGNSAGGSYFPFKPNTAIAEPGSTIYSTLRDLFHHISHQPKCTGSVAPQAFITTLKRYNELFRSTAHQDAHEFLNFLLNSVAEDVTKEEENRKKLELNSSLTEPIPPGADPLINPSSRPRPEETGPTWVHKLFEGVLTNETKCLTCETVTQRDESFLDLSIDIEQNTSLTACLRQFSASEMLCRKNKFSCDRCCSLQEAEKRMKIKKLPNVLALHLKRFKYQENLQRYIKLTYRVVFPFEIRLFNTTDDIANPDRLYELWAIVVHIGTGPHHGHYVTILKSNGQWLMFDDNAITRIEEQDIQKYYGDTPGVGSGYVLFYQAVDLNLADIMGLDPDTEDEDEDEPDSDMECIRVDNYPSRNDGHPYSQNTLIPGTYVPDAGSIPATVGLEDLNGDSTLQSVQNGSLSLPPSRRSSVFPPLESSVTQPPAVAKNISATRSLTQLADITPPMEQSRMISGVISNIYSPQSKVIGLGVDGHNSIVRGQYPEPHVYEPRPLPSSSKKVMNSSPNSDAIRNGLFSASGSPPVLASLHAHPVDSNPSVSKGSPHASNSPELGSAFVKNHLAGPLSSARNSSEFSRRPTSSASSPHQRLLSNASSGLGSPLSLNQKISSRFLKRNKSSTPQSEATNESLTMSGVDHVESVKAGKFRERSSGLVSHAASDEPFSTNPMDDTRAPALVSQSSAAGPTTDALRNSHRHSLSNTNGGSVPQASSSTNRRTSFQSPLHQAGSSNIAARNYLTAGPSTLSQKQHLIHQSSLLIPRGAQAPPAIAPLTSKQQKEIKKATEKASKLAQKQLVKSLKVKEKEAKSRVKGDKKREKDESVNSKNGVGVSSRIGYEVNNNHDLGKNGVESSSNVQQRPEENQERINNARNGT